MATAKDGHLDPWPRTDAEALTFVSTKLQIYANHSAAQNFDKAFIRAVKVHAVQLETPKTPGTITFRFAIPDTYVNLPAAGTIHGGAIATAFDNLTSMITLTAQRYRWENAGVTRNLSVTYFRPPVKDEELELLAVGVSIGKRSATVRGELRRVRDGMLLAMCVHEKVLADRQVHFKL